MGDASRGGGSRRWNRGDWLLALLLVALAAGPRAWLFTWGVGGEALPIGPDAQDWALAARAYLLPTLQGLEPHRYPLLPWAAAHLSVVDGLSPLYHLWFFSWASGSLLAGLTWLLARRWLPTSLALLPACWVALDPGQVSLSNQPTAYAFAAAAFLTLTLGLLAARGVVAAALTAVAALALVASLHQGLLSLLFLLPAGLWLRRWRAVATALLGAAAGLVLVYLLHPRVYDPLLWMGAETLRYLGGNVAEETHMRGLTWWRAWPGWCRGVFHLPPLVVLATLALALAGLARPSPWRRERWALAWAVAPLTVLLPLMASPHHLAHLTPLLAVLVALGLTWLPGRLRWPAALLLCPLLVLGGFRAGGPLLDEVRVQAAQAAAQLRFGRTVQSRLGSRGLLLMVRSTAAVDPIWRSRWALPVGVEIAWVEGRPGCHGEQVLQAALEHGAGVAVVTGSPQPVRWQVGRFQLATPSDSVRVSFPGDVHRYLFVVEPP